MKVSDGANNSMATKTLKSKHTTGRRSLDRLVRPPLSNTEMALAYYKAGIEGNRPDYVPARIKLHARVHGDGPFYGTFADAGEHDCHSNQWGALSVRATNGRMLGVKPKEFEPVSWRPNGGGKPRGE